jgi:choline kinase
MHLIVLASGKGSRLGQLTKDKPKCFLKVDGKYIIDHLAPIFKYFEKVFIVVGHKRAKFYEKQYDKTKIVLNKNYKNTNMVESLFSVSEKIYKDCIMVYSDIVFDLSILRSLINKRGTIMPVNTEWLNLWKKRMSYKKIKLDAENLTMNKDYLSSIGEPINKKFPTTQYMGILKITKFDYRILKKFYIRLRNRKVDMTTFLNLVIKKKFIKIKVFRTKKYWFEIDTRKDLILANDFFQKELKN